MYVLLDREGHPRLTDFGLAKDLAPSRSQTVEVPGQFMGTPGYWAPELARGDPAALSPRSDVYGLGAILYATLTGRPPQGEAETLVEALDASQRAPEPPSALDPRVDAALDRVVLRCLAIDPRRRFADMDAVRDALLGLAGPPAPNRAVWIAALLLLAGVTGALGVVAGSARGVAPPAATDAAAETPSPNAATDAAAETPSPSAAASPSATASMPLAGDPQPTPPPADPEAEHRAAAAFSRARAHQMRGETELALAAFEEVIRLAPRYDAYESRGVIRAARGDTAGALADFARAIELAPNRGTPYCNRGVLRLRTREHALALEDFDRAVARALPAELPAFLTNRAEAREHLRDLPGALSDWRRYLELTPGGSYAPLARSRVAALERALGQ